MEYNLKLTDSEVLRLLVTLNHFRNSSPTSVCLIAEIEKQTGVEL